MKIRRKLPKSPRSARPLFIVGYPSEPPSVSDLQTWFDVEYGGPAKLTADGKTEKAHSPPTMLVTHGPWTAWLRLSIAASEAEEWKTRLSWRHIHASAIGGTSIMPSQGGDAILHAARLARGLTLLTDGTTYDVVMQSYFNPSDWKDRPLDRFRVSDHVTVVHADAVQTDAEWVYTRGLSKFGLDEIETFRPIGLPIDDVMKTLADIAEEIIRHGHAPNVGLTLPLPALGLAIRVVRHRTAFPGESPLPLREITWEPLAL